MNSYLVEQLIESVWACACVWKKINYLVKDKFQISISKIEYFLNIILSVVHFVPYTKLYFTT